MYASLNDRIQRFYDASSGLWEKIWGEHMHHGYYGADGTEKKERRQAQIDLIEELLNWSEVGNASNILDVGCGIGGSSLYLAQRYRARTTGISLSPVQIQRAQERAGELGLSARANFQVADALNMPFADNSFDLVWTLESGEHMPDKVKFLRECYRVLQPGGTLIMATWCHRPTEEFPLTTDEQKLLAEIYRVYCLPYVISLPEYIQIAENLHLNNLKSADWSIAVAPFWDVVIDSTFTLEALFGLLTSGWSTIQGALGLGLMQRGYKSGLIRFGLICGKKGAEEWRSGGAEEQGDKNLQLSIRNTPPGKQATQLITANCVACFCPLGSIANCELRIANCLPPIQNPKSKIISFSTTTD